MGIFVATFSSHTHIRAHQSNWLFKPFIRAKLSHPSHVECMLRNTRPEFTSTRTQTHTRTHQHNENVFRFFLIFSISLLSFSPSLSLFFAWFKKAFFVCVCVCVRELFSVSVQRLIEQLLPKHVHKHKRTHIQCSMWRANERASEC